MEIDQTNKADYLILAGDLNARVDNVVRKVGEPHLNNNGVRPVSYTHLDVYKRQVLDT